MLIFICTTKNIETDFLKEYTPAKSVNFKYLKVLFSSNSVFWVYMKVDGLFSICLVPSSSYDGENVSGRLNLVF